jgi:stress response protein YsnF/uncharacterized membrane protein
MKTVVGVFRDAGEARRTIEELMTLGVPQKDISVVTGPTDGNVMRLEMASLDVTDVGRLAACGPLAEVIRGSGRGALTGSLRHFGLPADLAAHYTNAVREGETLESIMVEDRDADRVVEVMNRHAARIGEGPTMGGAATGAAAAAAGAAAAGAPLKERGAGFVEKIEQKIEQKIENVKGKLGGNEAEAKRGHFSGDVRDEERAIPIVREQLRVGKREVERGHVHVSVNVVEKPVSEHINLREEYVDIERRTVDRAARPEETALKGDIDMTEYAEVPVVTKEARVVEEIIVHKRVTSRDEVISDKLRSTDVDVSRDGADRTAFKQYLESRGINGNYEEHYEAHELGRTLRGTGARWEDIEANARTRWESKRPGTWDRFKESISRGWLTRSNER